MACQDCIEVTGLPFPCSNKVAGGFERKIWFIRMCELDANPFISVYANGVVDDILILNGAVFREVNCVKDSIKLASPHEILGRMVDTTLSFSVNTMTADSDRVLAAAQMREFQQAMQDNPEQLCFIVEERRDDSNVPVRRIVPSMDAEPFGGENGAKAEDGRIATLNYKKRVANLPYVLDAAYVIPT